MKNNQVKLINLNLQNIKIIEFNKRIKKHSKYIQKIKESNKTLLGIIISIIGI